MFRTIIILFFALNALFWGLFPHQVHCQVASMFNTVCPPHWVHLLTGIISFFIAILVAQWGYVKYLMS